MSIPVLGRMQFCSSQQGTGSGRRRMWFCWLLPWAVKVRLTWAVTSHLLYRRDLRLVQGLVAKTWWGTGCSPCWSSLHQSKSQLPNWLFWVGWQLSPFYIRPMTAWFATLLCATRTTWRKIFHWRLCHLPYQGVVLESRSLLAQLFYRFHLVSAFTSIHHFYCMLHSNNF